MLKKEWCESGGGRIEPTLPVDELEHFVYKVRGKVRCPSCNKRLVPRLIYCRGGEYAGGQYYPAHKEKKKILKKIIRTKKNKEPRMRR